MVNAHTLLIPMNLIHSGTRKKLAAQWIFLIVINLIEITICYDIINIISWKLRNTYENIF